MSDRRMAEPYLHHAGVGQKPRSWVAVPVGTDAGGHVLEVVYDPERYDVMVAHGRRPGDFPELAEESSPALMSEALDVSGWKLLDQVSSTRVWVRDLDAAAEISEQRQADGLRPAVTFEDAAPVVPFALLEGAKASTPDAAHPAVTFEDREPTFPVIRPEGTEGPVPEGWDTAPFGTWKGVSSEVVYDPKRHACMRVAANSPPRTLENLASVGYELTATDQTSYLLVRDRVAQARTWVERLDQRPPPEVGGIGL